MTILFKRSAFSHKTNRTSLTQSPALPSLLYGRVNSLMYVLESKCSRLPLLAITTTMFTFIIVVSMLAFVVILINTNICKQVCSLHCFVSVAFVYNFNVKRHKTKHQSLGLSFS